MAHYRSHKIWPKFKSNRFFVASHLFFRTENPWLIGIVLDVVLPANVSVTEEVYSLKVRDHMKSLYLFNFTFFKKSFFPVVFHATPAKSRRLAIAGLVWIRENYGAIGNVA